MTVGCGNDRQFVEFCDRIGESKLAQYPAFETNAKRVENREKLLNILSHQMQRKTTDEWNEIFDGAGFPYGAVNSLDRVFSDEQVKSSFKSLNGAAK